LAFRTPVCQTRVGTLRATADARPAFAAWLPAARDLLGDERFQRTWTEGHAMDREQAVAYALEGAPASDIA